MAGYYALELCDGQGATIAGACTGGQREFTFTRNEPCTLRTAFDVDGEPAAQLAAALAANELPRYRVWRDGVLLAYGRWGAQQDSAQAEGAQVMAPTFRGADAILERRFVGPAGVTFTGEDAGDIWWSLIDATNTDSPTGIVLGAIAATVNRDRAYEAGKQVLEAGKQLTDVDGGFDYEIVPVYDPAAPDPDVLGELHVYASQGSDRTADVVFEYGPGTLANITDLGRDWTPPINRATVYGADGLYGTDEDAASIATYGLWETQDQQVDVSEQATLDAKATALLRPDPIRVVSFTPDPSAAPQPKTDYWLGDVVTLRARAGAIVEDLAVRINQITIRLDDDDSETVTLAIEAAI